MRFMALVVGILLTWVPVSIAQGLPFPEISGWKYSTENQLFITKTLYEYINGAADLYLACDFEELKVADPHHGIIDLYWKGRYIRGPLICRMPVCDQNS
jgi:hypothetical protein